MLNSKDAENRENGNQTFHNLKNEYEQIEGHRELTKDNSLSKYLYLETKGHFTALKKYLYTHMYVSIYI